VDAQPERQTSGQHADAGRRAHRRRTVETREPRPFRRQAIQPRRLHARAAKTADVAIAEVIGQKHHQVGPRFRGGAAGQQRQGEKDEGGFHRERRNEMEIGCSAGGCDPASYPLA